MSLIQEVGTYGVYVSAALATLNVVSFAVLARFWRSRGGWHMFCDMLVLAWILDMIVTRVLVGDDRWLAWVRTLSFAVGLPVMMIWRFWIIFDLQVRARNRGVAYRGRREEEAQ